MIIMNKNITKQVVRDGLQGASFVMVQAKDDKGTKRRYLGEGEQVPHCS
jgi:hypothetical protein